VKKKITDKDFLSAKDDINNKNILFAASKKYKFSLNADEIQSCADLALWKCLIHHNHTYKRKFTTSLFKFMMWECLHMIREKSNFCQILYDSAEDLQDIMDNFIDAHIYLDKLKPNDRNVLCDRFFNHMTLSEIGNKYSYSKETARRRVLKAMDNLRNIAGVGV
jgi:RNA polymerase sigma factor (sigma-70 family)